MRRALFALVAAAASGCDSSPITADRLERAIEPTFTNLVRVQVSWLDLPPLSAADLDVTASCRRSVAGSDAGSGEWTCRVRWRGPDRQTLRDTFGVYVTTDGCYTATAEGNSLGGPTLKTPRGGQVRNLLYAFEGCFDTM